MGINGPAIGSVDNVSWQYTITFTNRTSDIIDEIVVFFARKNQAGVEVRIEKNWVPGETRIFVLGICNQMASYNIGCFIGSTMIARLPASGEMTPQRASQDNPTDHFLCEDSWSLNSG